MRDESERPAVKSGVKVWLATGLSVLTGLLPAL
jgi:hypothetical protein